MQRLQDSQMLKLLFLGYDRTQTRLIEAVEGRGCTVQESADPVTDLSNYDLAISFGYRHILRKDVLDTAKRPVLNLHIAYLPWNRGAHPLFWSAFDGTPAGVTIHEIDAGIDTGPICFQKKVYIDPDTETFASGYKRLIDEMEAIFEEHADELLTGAYSSQPQEGTGSAKRVRDLPAGFTWSETISPTIKRLKQAANA